MHHKLVALVTGANKGIGLAIAKGLVERGLTVLIGSRNLEHGVIAAESIGPVASSRSEAPEGRWPELKPRQQPSQHLRELLLILALLGEDGTTGTFSDDNGPITW